MAEEVVNPARDMPVGIVSCILLVTIIYILMAVRGQAKRAKLAGKTTQIGIKLAGKGFKGP
jgi:hypothetical protein